MSTVPYEYYDAFMELWRGKFISAFGTKPGYEMSEAEKAFPVALLDAMLLACACGADQLTADSISKQASLFFVRRNSHEGLDAYSGYFPHLVFSIKNTLDDDHKKSIIRKTDLPGNPYVDDTERYIIFALDMSAIVILHTERYRGLPFDLGSMNDHNVYCFLSDAMYDYCKHMEKNSEAQERTAPPASRSTISGPDDPPIMTFRRFVKLALIGLAIGFILYLIETHK